MPKRFTETDKWRKTWFRKLSCAEKSAWFYITESCDAVGVWDADTELAEYLIGEKIDWEAFVDKTNGNIEVLQNGKWWLVDFCEFQYKDLNEHSESRPIQSYIRLLKKHGLWGRFKGLPKGMDSVQDKEKEKDKEKDKEKETYAPGIRMEKTAYDDMCKRFGKKTIDGYIEKISDFQLSKGKRYKDMPATIKNWMRRERGVDSVNELEIQSPLKCPKCGKPLDNEIKNSKSYCMTCDADISALTQKPP